MAITVIAIAYNVLYFGDLSARVWCAFCGIYEC